MQNYRVKLPLIVAALLLFVEAILLFSCFRIASATRERLSEEDFNIKCYALERRAENRFDVAETVLKACENANVTDFTEASTATLAKADLEALADRAGNYLDELDIPVNAVDAVIILGSTYDKASYVKKMGEDGVVSRDLPTMAQLKFVRMREWETLSSHEWLYYEEGQLDEIFDEGIRMSGISISEKAEKGIRDFLSLLDGRLVLTTRSLYGGSQIFVTVRCDFLKDILEQNDASITLLYDERTLFSSLGEKEKLTVTSHGGEEDSWVSGGAVRLQNRTISLKNGDFSMIISDELAAGDEGMDFMPVLLLVGLGMVVFAALLACLMAELLLNPLRRLRVTFNEQFNNGAYEEIKWKVPGRSIPLPMVYRVLIILLCSALLPAIASGFVFQRQLDKYVLETNYRYMGEVSSAVSENVRDLMNSTILYSELYPEEQIAGFIRSTYKTTTILKTKLDTIYAESDMFTHFALFDEDRNEIYNTKTVYAYDPLNLDTVGRRQRTNGWYYVMMTVDNTEGAGHLLPAIVYPIYEEELGGRTLVGYFALYLNMTNFYDLRPDIGHEFIITGPHNEVLISSVSSGTDKDFLEKAGSGLGNMNTATDEYLILEDTNGIFGGRIITYNDMRYYSEQSALLRSNYYFMFVIVMVFLLAASLFLSRRLSEPLQTIGDSMQHIGDVSDITPIRYARKDEVGALVESYNLMVARMAALIEENARRINRENELIALNTRTELQMLQQQINPHLLYNTLEFINYNARREGASAAGAMAVALADFFRYTTSVKEDIVSFADELKHVKNYIQIHRLRYGERFDVVYDVTEEAESCRVVKFILQPFVENAFKYGIADKMRGALITISAKVEEGRFVMILSDNGVGMRKNKLEELQRRIDSPEGEEDAGKGRAEGGVGMRNVARRLRMYYGDKASIVLGSEFMRGFKVTISIPVEKPADTEQEELPTDGQ